MKIGAFVLIVLSCLTFMLSAYNLFLVFSHPLKFKDEIIICSKEFNFEPELIASIINTESSFKENSKSNKSAIGLMQIKLSTANYLNDINGKNHITENDLFSPKSNIRYGCEYLQYLLTKFKILETALCAYNAGETNVKNWLKSPTYSLDGKKLINIPFAETKNYIIKIKNNLKYYKKLFI